MAFSKPNKRILAGGGAAALTVAAVFGASAVSAQTLTENATGFHDGFYYSFWKDEPGQVSFGLEEGGRYTSEWGSNINNWVGGKGWNPGGPKVVNYSGTYSPASGANSYLALYGWTKDPLIEYYVIESYGVYNPASCSGGTDHGSFQSDGATYNVRSCQRVQQPSIEGTQTFMQYFSVREPKRPFGEISGTVTVGNHFDYWESQGLELGNHDYMILATEGYQSGGSSDLTVSEGARDCGTDSGTPVCCEISADVDGDGMGVQFDGQMCVVTEETLGWHPANPEGVVAAINVGGSGEAIAIGDIWYAPNTYVTGATPNFTADPVSGGGGSEVYTSEGYGDLTVEIPASGNVSVQLGFAELYWEETGARLFDVAIEGETVLGDVDLYAEVGHDTVWLPTPFEVNVADGSLSISVTGTVDNGTLSSILVLESDGVTASSSSAMSSSSSSASSSSQVSSSSVSSESSSSSSSSSSSAPTSSVSSSSSSSVPSSSASSSSSSVASSSVASSVSSSSLSSSSTSSSLVSSASSSSASSLDSDNAGRGAGGASGGFLVFMGGLLLLARRFTAKR